MNRQIRRYLDEHGATYTPEALRKGLLDAGYDPAEVDAALGAWNAGEPAGPEAEGRRTFRRWAFRLHLGALLAMVVLLIALRGADALGLAGAAAIVLAIALLIGWAVSSLIGRALLPRTGPMIALVVPAISAIALGGSCLALMVSALGPAAHAGTVHLQILAPLAFDASGPATCRLPDAGGVQINASNFGDQRIGGKQVNLSLNWYGNGPTAPAPPSNIDLSISLSPVSGTESPETYAPIFSSKLDLSAATGRLSGSVLFEGLVHDAFGPSPGAEARAPISGSLSWTCQ